jgi:hypothetical protein
MNDVTRAVVLGAVAAGAILACKSNDVGSTTTNTTMGIGPSGGMAQGANGEELLVPAGALTSNVAFSLSVAQPGSGSYPSAPPAGLDFVGDVFEFQPHGTQFITPATVVVPYKTTPTTPILLQAEEGATTWSTVSVTGTQTGAVEGAVSTLSYFVVADMGGGSDGSTGNSCAGRGPVATAPTGSVTMGMGMVPAQNEGNVSIPALDVTTLVDGYATGPMAGGMESGECGSGTVNTLSITLTPYAKACGYAQNDDVKIGAVVLGISVNSFSAITAQAYTAGEVSTVTNWIASGTDAGVCAGNANGAASSGCPSGATALTITALDSTHVAGNFNLTPSGSSTAISGTFDVPVCTAATGLMQCCVQ